MNFYNSFCVVCLHGDVLHYSSFSLHDSQVYLYWTDCQHGYIVLPMILFEHSMDCVVLLVFGVKLSYIFCSLLSDVNIF